MMGRLIDFKRLVVGAAFVLGVSLSVQGNCLHEGSLVWCQWGGANPGCFSVNNLYEPNVGADCADLVGNCLENGLGMFSGVNSSHSSMLGPGWGAGANCEIAGGTQVGGTQGTGMFCNYGACVGSASGGDGCVDGGCYPQKIGEACTGGSVVSICPCANLPPNAVAANAPCDGGDTGGGTGELCRDPQNRQLYCQWGTG
ncbi:MAG: hypothetical protein FWE57_11125, partial [Chitinispirillia bacterium]|nr:hypothetical protein [Chitinispirillia bacterium]